MANTTTWKGNIINITGLDADWDAPTDLGMDKIKILVWIKSRFGVLRFSHRRLTIILLFVREVLPAPVLWM